MQTKIHDFSEIPKDLDLSRHVWPTENPLRLRDHKWDDWTLATMVIGEKWCLKWTEWSDEGEMIEHRYPFPEWLCQVLKCEIRQARNGVRQKIRHALEPE